MSIIKETKLSLGTRLANSYQEVLAANHRFNELVKEIGHAEDTRDLLTEFEKQDGSNLAAKSRVLRGVCEVSMDNTIKLPEVLYVKEREEIDGKGNWRELTENGRVTIPAITELRKRFGLGLVEAKHVVEAYIWGIFK